jgi:hypothetical protein
VLLLGTGGCNPSYLAGRHPGGSQFEDSPSKQFLRPYVEKTHYKKRAGGVAQVIGPEVQTPVLQKKKKCDLVRK